jgi:hypothetical protein
VSHSVINFHIEQLARMGTDQIAHRNGTLLEHLKGVWNLLNEWRNPEPVCLAGLYHSLYSTGGFEPQLIPLSNRDEITYLIGDEAERLVYLFCACDRPLTHPGIGKDEPMEFHDRFTDKDYPLEYKEWCALCEIMLANELDLGRHDPAFYNKHLDHHTDLFSRFEPWLSDSAIKANHDFKEAALQARRRD